MQHLISLFRAAAAVFLSFGLAAQGLESGSIDSGVPKGLTTTEWSSIRSAYDAGRHAVLSVDGGYEARNPGQGWNTRFEDGGFLVRPDAGDWTWGLELKRYGFAGRESTVSKPSKASADGGRVVYRWDTNLDEWYINDQRGLEHGFTVRQRPAGSDQDRTSPLSFSLAVRGGLRMAIMPGQRGVQFLNRDDSVALTYTGLTVFDADGKNVEAGFQRDGDLLRLAVYEADARYPLTIDPLVQQCYLKAHNTDQEDFFGCAVAVSGDTVVIGACGEDSNATGINGNRNDNSASAAGAVYVFVRTGSIWSHHSWTQQAYLKASNTDAGDLFGSAVAISGDVILVGAPGESSAADGINTNQADNSAKDTGAVYVFVRKTNYWCQLTYIKASDSDAGDRFGHSVAVDGKVAVVGAYGEDSNATGVNGDDADNSANLAGAAYVFIEGNSWFFAQQQAYLKASNTGAGDRFGFAVAVSGNRAVVGAYGESSSAKGVNGDESNNSANEAGAAYVFKRKNNQWSQASYLKASNTDHSDYFGSAVGISGDVIVVGAYGEDGDNTIQLNNNAPFAGAAYVYKRGTAGWVQEMYLKATNTNWGDRFGRSVAIDGDTIVVGAPEEDSKATGVNGDQYDNSASYSGAAYVFVKGGPTWFYAKQRAYVKSSNTGAHDEFGLSVGVSGVTVVAGAYGEDSMSTGVNGDQINKSAYNAGAAFVFEHCLAASEKIGRGCSSGSAPPVLDITRPVVGQSSTVMVTGANSKSHGVALVGYTHNGIPLGGGCTAYVQLMLPTVSLLFNTNNNGVWTSAPFSIPNSPAMLCVRIAVQAGVHNPTVGPLGMETTNAVWLKVGF